jgi:DNA-directed RNA polymerase subunit M/transcription elongation factor TFIIS
MTTTVIEFYIPEKTRKQSNKQLAKFFPNKKCTMNIEQGLYDYTEQYCKNNNNYIIMAQAIYNDIIKNLLFNCEQNCTTMKKIKKEVNNDKYNGYNLAFLGPTELNEDNWMKIILRKNTTEEKFNNLPTITWKACRDCKSTQYSFYQLQTRSADEPITTFYICKQCGKTFKVNN